MSDKEALVYIALGNENIRVGTLWFHHRQGKENASFEYNSAWLKHPEKFALDPALKLTEGAFHTQEGKSNFGAIGDSAPDRWGRALMRRQETKRAQEAKQTSRTLFEINYLLGVSDEARQGALRFSLKPDDQIFLAGKKQRSIPLLIVLPKLLTASDHFLAHEESAEDLKLLIAPGSSLGGARPKASIFDKDGSLAIVKFPRRDDEFNVVLWEAVALTLAKNAKINAPSWRLEKVLKQPVLIIKRFDRKNELRIPFLSAMSMLSARDNEDHSYLELVYALIKYGAMPDEDMEELWRRIIFTILISNTDDHLRNHGFIYERHQGWRLSPVYDVNPTPVEIKPRILTTSIDFNDGSVSLDKALNVAKEFRISKHKQSEIIKEVTSAVIKWRQVALELGLSKDEIARMDSAFEHQDLEQAKKIR